MKLLRNIIKNKFSPLVLTSFALVFAQYTYADVLTPGFCWGSNTGWIDMLGVDFDPDTREFSGSASFYNGQYSTGIFSDGEIDFTAQGGTPLSMTLSSVENADGNFPILGQAFSEEIGWVFADHGGSMGTEAAVTPDGELTGNFWSNEFGWIQCDSASIGIGNTQIWDMGSIGVPNGSSSGKKRSILYACKDVKALNYKKSLFRRHKQSLCEYANEPIAPSLTTTIEAKDPLGGGKQCPESQILTQNLRAPATDGRYNTYTKAVVTEAKILQEHMNRLGFNSGPEDGIIGPLTDGAIKRMQIFLGTTPDGHVTSIPLI